MATQEHRLALPQGTQVQDFEFHRVLGHGGFGITYLGWNVALDIAVAIKEYLPADLAMREQDMSILPKSAGDETDFQWGLDRFLDEARVMARFKHPNIVQVQHFFQAHGTAYIVMEYVEGETLAALLKRRGTLTEIELKNILLPLLAGLVDVHEAGILHRDIKPGNILLRAADGSPVLVDFGAARQAIGARSRSVTAVLTPGYAPIEQYSSRGHQGPWTDIYALGSVCYQALTGKVPDEAMDRIRSDPLTPVVEAGKDKATEAFLSAVDWALRVEEADRPQGVRLWRATLLGESEVPEPVSSSPPATTPPDRKSGPARKGGSRVAGWLLALGVVALAGAGAWWGWQEYPEWFGKDPGDDTEMAEQELQAGGETTPTEATGLGEAPANAEETAADLEPDNGASEAPPPDDTPQAAPAEATAETAPVVADEEAAPAEGTEAGPNRSEPGPEPPVEDDEITRLLAAAEADLEARRLTSPAGNNAWERYQRVLELAPAHPEAVRGMERVIESYMELFGAAVEQEEFDKAAGYLERIRGLHPDSPVLEEGEQRLRNTKQAQADRLALLQAVREHWESFDAAVSREDFEGAASYLARIRELRPDAPELPDGEGRLAAAKQAQAERLAEQERQRKAEAARQAELFEESLKDKDFDRAASYLERVRELHPGAPVLVEGEQRLAEARQAELERQRLESEARARKAIGEMVSIPGGTFRMGDLSGAGYDDEKPVHSVTVPALRLGKYEVTFAQWDACVADGGCGGYTPNDAGWGRGNRPVITVSWDDVQGFIGWLNAKTGGNFRLPTEAEWEYAARAGSTTKFSWGNDIGQNRANCHNDYCGDRWEYTAPVGSFPANAWGLHDMHGNVYEWVQDCWNGSYTGAPSDGRAWTSGKCSQRVIRGGSWFLGPGYLRSAFRSGSTRTNRFNNQGFRLAQDL